MKRTLTTDSKEKALKFGEKWNKRGKEISAKVTPFRGSLIYKMAVK